MTDGPTTAWRCRPSPAQERLLRACLADEADALAAWNDWRATQDLDAIDEESLRLLPLAWHRLHAVAPRERTLEIAKGVYRRAWTRNQLAFRALAGALDALAGAGVEAMLLKGASLATRYYPAPATRPMADVDLLVPHRDAGRAADALVRAGWRAARATPVPRLQAYVHGLAFGRDAVELDLHWNALWAQRRADADDPFWAQAVRVAFERRDAFALAPADELFHTCMHGARRSQNAYSWAPAPLARWIVDACMIARAGPVDWARVDALAARFHARLQLRDAFGYLADAHGFAVPPALLDDWARAATPADALHYDLALAARAPSRFRDLPRFRFWASYRMKVAIDAAARGDAPPVPLARLVGFPGYVLAFAKADLDAASVADIPLRLARKLAARPSILKP